MTIKERIQQSLTREQVIEALKAGKKVKHITNHREGEWIRQKGDFIINQDGEQQNSYAYFFWINSLEEWEHGYEIVN